MFSTIEGNLQKEKPQFQQEEEDNLCCQEGIGKKKENATLMKKEGDEKGTCFLYGVKGHWKMNFMNYLNEKAQKKHGNAFFYLYDRYLVF